MKSVDLSSVRLEPLSGHTSKGDQPKWQFRGKWYKADHMGYEALSEVLVSRLLEKSNIGAFVRYEPMRIVCDGKATPGCESENFRAGDEMLVPFERLHRAYKGYGLALAIAGMDGPAERIAYTVNFIQSVTGLTGVGEHFTALVELDALFLNGDRHTNNLAVIRNERTGAFRLCPVFDNGLALLSDLRDYPLEADVYESIARVKAKPFDENFDRQLAAAEALYGPQLKCSFTRQDVEDALSDLAELYDVAVLERVRQCLFEQMRKYLIFF